MKTQISQLKSEYRNNGASSKAKDLAANLRARGASVAQIAQALGLTTRAVYNWTNRKAKKTERRTQSGSIKAIWVIYGNDKKALLPEQAFFDLVKGAK
jgi:lambda repressor-like predicted transcriptional regulator